MHAHELELAPDEEVAEAEVVEKSIEEQAAEMTARIMEKMRAEEAEAGGSASAVWSRALAGGILTTRRARPSGTARSGGHDGPVWDRVFAPTFVVSMARDRGCSGRGCRRPSSPVSC